MDCYGAYTNNPPCGAMRGFGSVQTAFAVEATMDRLAEAIGLDPVEIRVRNGFSEGSIAPTGQVIDSAAPVAELVERLRAMPLPGTPPDLDRHDQRHGLDLRRLPGGVANSTHGEGIRRGVGYAVAYKNVAFSEGFDDYTVARVRLSARDRVPVAEVHTAAAEVGQGVVGVIEQVVRSELGVEDVRFVAADTRVGSAGAASASRLTWMIAGAMREACQAVRERLGSEPGPIPEEGIEEEATYRHRSTSAMDPSTGRGGVHTGFAFVAHRAVVDVDVELGVARVAELACAQDVGRAINPLAVEGQLEGGGMQGLGLALMEEMVVDGGVVLSRSLGEYRIPTIVDAPDMPSIVLELGNPDAPYGVTGVGEMASITSTPAVLAALRDATGRELTRVPARPEDLADVAVWAP
jgi:CO/xanthine dehydrogenase Mo-binding subunit